MLPISRKGAFCQQEFAGGKVEGMFGKSSLFALALSLFFFMSAGASAETCNGQPLHGAAACQTPVTYESPAPEGKCWFLMLAGSGMAGAVLRRRRSRGDPGAELSA
ncbi:MAG TPA: hypothetical protein VME40_07885 [Caulobacteraceae bacterium]|nr:hypothetical protein [Caulobacteraceae bacterium]